MISQKLKTEWAKAVKQNEIVHDFKVNNESWRFGLKQKGKHVTYFAKNLTRNKDIKAQILERRIKGTNFTIQWNQFRALRPVTAPKNLGRQPDISGKTSDCRFACSDNKNPLSLAKRRPLAELKLKNYTWNFYHNAFPYDTSGHFLVVPQKNAKLPHLRQEFDKKLLPDTLDLISKSQGLIVMFQSLHAGASVNHFHLQAFFHNKKYALDQARIIDNVLDDYPVPAFVYHTKKEKHHAQKAIMILQKEKIPFDLIAANNNLYLFPRNPNHEVVSEFPHGIIGAMELMGKFVTTDEKVYKNFDIHKLYRSLNKTCLEI